MGRILNEPNITDALSERQRSLRITEPGKREAMDNEAHELAERLFDVIEARETPEDREPEQEISIVLGALAELAGRIIAGLDSEQRLPRARTFTAKMVDAAQRALDS